MKLKFEDIFGFNLNNLFKINEKIQKSFLETFPYPNLDRCQEMRMNALAGTLCLKSQIAFILQTTETRN